MKIRLVRPNISLKKKALDFKRECLDNGTTVINGGALLDKMDSYEEWLDYVNANTVLETVNPIWVQTDTFFALDENDTLVGMIDLRHSLNDFLKDFGHCGYTVRPSERRKGYATEMVKQIAKIAQKLGMSELQLATKISNEASVKTILNNGGIDKRDFIFDGEPGRVYTISL